MPNLGSAAVIASGYSGSCPPGRDTWRDGRIGAVAERISAKLRPGTDFREHYVPHILHIPQEELSQCH